MGDPVKLKGFDKYWGEIPKINSFTFLPIGEDSTCETALKTGEIQIGRSSMINFKSFETEIDEIWVFSPEFVRIVWVHLSNCAEIQKLVDEKLKGLFEKEHRFMSHVTIARVKYLKNKNWFLGELKKIKIPSDLKFKINKFSLKKSTLTPEGPFYETLEEYKLI